MPNLKAIVTYKELFELIEAWPARTALLRVFSEVLPAFGGFKPTPARRALEPDGDCLLRRAGTVFGRV